VAQDWTCPFELIRALEGWIADCNKHSLYSALSYKPPGQFEGDDYRSHAPPFLPA
jgi:hypothetical protein